MIDEEIFALFIAMQEIVIVEDEYQSLDEEPYLLLLGRSDIEKETRKIDIDTRKKWNIVRK